MKLPPKPWNEFFVTTFCLVILLLVPCLFRKKLEAGMWNKGKVKHHFIVHAAYYCLVTYRPMILQYSEILACSGLLFLTSVYGKLTVLVLLSMLGLWCDKIFVAMKNYDNEDEGGDDNGIEDETTMKIPIPDQDPIVWSFIRSQSLIVVEKDWGNT